MKKCDGCHHKTDNIIGWVFYHFKHLKDHWLCVKCQPVWSEHFSKLQEQGL